MNRDSLFKLTTERRTVGTNEFIQAAEFSIQQAAAEGMFEHVLEVPHYVNIKDFGDHFKALGLDAVMFTGKIKLSWATKSYDYSKFSLK